jgi:hypothetical protein
MPYVSRTARRNGVGEPSSKYGYPGGGEQFERDIRQHHYEAEQLYDEFVEWFKERKAEPETVRLMFIRFYDEFIDTGV